MARFILYIGLIASLIAVFTFLTGISSVGHIINHPHAIEWGSEDESQPSTSDGISGPGIRKFRRPENYFYIHGDFSVSGYEQYVDFRPAIVKSTAWLSPNRLSIIRENGNGISEIPLYAFPMNLGIFAGGYGADHFIDKDLFAYTSTQVGEKFDVTVLDFSDRRQFGFSAVWARSSCNEFFDSNTQIRGISVAHAAVANEPAYRLRMMMVTSCKWIEIKGQHNAYNCKIRDIWWDDDRPTTMLNVYFDRSGSILSIDGTAATSQTYNIGGCEVPNGP